MTALKNLALRLVRDEEGQDLIEYALLAALVSIIAITIIIAIGTNVNTVYSKVNSGVIAGGS